MESGGGSGHFSKAEECSESQLSSRGLCIDSMVTLNSTTISSLASPVSRHCCITQSPWRPSICTRKGLVSKPCGPSASILLLGYRGALTCPHCCHRSQLDRNCKLPGNGRPHPRAGRLLHGILAGDIFVTAHSSSTTRTGITAFKPSNQKVIEFPSNRKVR